MHRQIAFLTCFAFAGFAIAAEPEPKGRSPLKVGDELPFNVADFVAGPHQGHCGCPSVMIGNYKVRGLVIWARTVDEPVLELAAAFEGKGIDGKKAHGYLIAFDISEEQLAENTKKGEWKTLTIGASRHDSKQEFPKWGFDAKVAYIVFLVDRKQVKQMWTMSGAELTKEKRDAIIRDSSAFLLGDGKK
jgi:hypothetical protein